MNKVWGILKSPKTVNFVKLLIAAVGVVHALDEFRNSSGLKKKIGFHLDQDDE
jgi:hypothetical protein